MSSLLSFVTGGCLVFLLFCLAENRGYIRRIKKFGNPQIGGRASLKGRWNAPNQRKKG
jgi:hypothetical protein